MVLNKVYGEFKGLGDFVSSDTVAFIPIKKSGGNVEGQGDPVEEVAVAPAGREAEPAAREEPPVVEDRRVSNALKKLSVQRY